MCWSRRNGTIRTRTPCLGAVRDLAWSADGAVLVGTGDDAILCWPTAGASNGARRSSSGRVPFQLAHRPGAVPTALACHPRHNLMAAGCDDGCVMLGDLDHARDLVIKHADGGAITALAWSPDGDFLIAGNDLGEALVLDFTSLTKCKRA